MTSMDGMFPGAAPDEFPGQAPGEAGSNTGLPLMAGQISLVSISPNTISLVATDASGGTPPYSYQWKRDGVDVGLDTLSLDDSGLSPLTTYTISLVYMDQDGNTDTATYTFTTPAGLLTALEPDLVIAFEPPPQSYVAGETRAIKFKITRPDGGLVDPPSDGSIAVTLPDGSTLTPLVPRKESDDPVTECIVWANCPFALPGRYTFKPLISLHGQTIGIETELDVE